MTSLLKQIANLLYRLFILLFLYSLCRLLFYIFNYQTFSDNSLYEITKVFFYGIRFDYSAIIQYNLLFLFVYLLPFNFVQHKKYKQVVGFLFCFINFLLLLLNLTDLEYFKFTGKRSTADIFNFIFATNDLLPLLPQFLKDFWYIVIFWLAFLFLGIYLFKKVPFRQSEHFQFTLSQWIGAISILFLLPCLLFISARGIGLKPIRIISAARYTKSQNIPLLLNTPFCILHTIRNEEFKPKTYFSPSELDKIYSPENQSGSNMITRRDNVVIIILESFSKEFIGSLNGKSGYTPFLDSIIYHSLTFENAFANGKQSIQALPAIFASLPDLMDNPYISSRFAGNRLDALPTILSASGYHTSFFHGGRNGTMGFDEFCNISGIKHYYGLNEYDGPPAFDGNWGIYDEPFLQFCAEKLNTFPQPFLSSVFTLSSHHPYTIPDKYNKTILAPNKQLKAIRYADYALSKFFKTIEKMPWFKNTLFVFVADHTAKEQTALYGTRAGIYRIPLAYYHLGDSTLIGLKSNVTQQTDIMPSILDYLGMNKPYFAFGKSVFSNEKSYSINYSGGIYQYFKGDFLFSFDGERSNALYNISKDKYLRINLLTDSVALASEMELKTKAIIQQFSSRVFYNRLFNKN